MSWLRRQPRGRHAPGNGVRTVVRPVGADPAQGVSVPDAGVTLGFSDGSQVRLLHDDPRLHAFRLVAAALVGDRESWRAEPPLDSSHGSRPSLVRPITSR